MRNTIRKILFTVFNVFILSSALHANHIEQLKEEANEGHAISAFMLGHSYLNGEGIERDRAEARQWYKKAADLGNTDALVALGLVYAEDGDCVQSFDCFSAAAEKGDASGENNLGISYLIGAGTNINLERGIFYLKKSAAQGWSEAQFNLGLCYAKGLGVKKDLRKAKAMFKDAAHRGVHKKLTPEVLKYGDDYLTHQNRYKVMPFVRNWSSVTFKSKE